MEIFNNEKSRVSKALLVLLVILSTYFAAKIITEVKSFNYIGGAAPASNTISFEGQGEVSAAPDLATLSFTIRAEAKEVEAAQNKVTAKESAVLKFLDQSGVAKKDIKTEFEVLVQDVTDDMENYRLHLASEKLYGFIWHRFADEILEESKGKEDYGETLYFILENSLKLLHPFMPFITEEIWSDLKSDSDSGRSSLLMIEPWPVK